MYEKNSGNDNDVNLNFANAADLSTNVNVSTQVPEPAKLVWSNTNCAPLSNYTTTGISVGTFTISGYPGAPYYNDLNITTVRGTKGEVQFDAVDSATRVVKYISVQLFVNKNGNAVKVGFQYTDGVHTNMTVMHSESLLR
ncbi:hypothetical protein [Escherichia coli]|uniref:hypothetical protein n=1 Tax=Escherichia coli TaxID=562 RepID=UPI0010805868|nr:hypothetical protein [Escherichia coli]TGH25679.1 hypothetical protein E5S59_17685 [Escherichia coli]